MAIQVDELRTKRPTLRVYLRCSSARVLLAVAAVLATVRLIVADYGRGDLIVVALTICALGTVEWTIHKFLLHAADDAWTSRRLGTGAGHRQHHLDPHALEWLVLNGADAAIFVAAFGAVTAAWTVPLMSMTGSAWLGPFVTGWLLAAVGLAHYEWVHLLVHTRCRLRSRYYKRLARNHRLHHYRNEDYWLGVTSNSGDRLLRTYPLSKSEVPLSATARTLRSPADDYADASSAASSSIES